METSLKYLSPNDQIAYSCKGCGACCRALEEQLMLEPLDAYRLGQHFRQAGEQIDIEDIYARFTHAAMLTEGFPIFLVNTVGAEHACVFLREHRCTVYPARPRTCRIYPLSAVPSEQGIQFQYYQCMDEHAGHFSGETLCVSDWMRQNLIAEDRVFLEKEADYVARLGQLLHRAGPTRQQDWLFPILFYRYYNYDLTQPFQEQYERNHMELLKQLSGKEQEDQS